MKRAAGFTLVEMMVALFIFGLVAATGVALLGFSVRAQAAAARQLDAAADERRTAAILTADFAQALPRVARDRDGNPVREFEGGDGRTPGIVVGYVRGGRSNPDGIARAGIERIDLVLERGRLERRSYPMADGASPGTSIVLAEDVESLALRYRDATGWRPRWDVPRPDALPSAIELTVKRRGRPALLSAFLVGTPYP